MTIYVVTSGAYSDYGIDAVFTNGDKAKEYCAIHNNGEVYREYRVEEYESDVELIDGDIRLQHKFVISEYQTRPSQYETVYQLSPKNRNHVCSFGGKCESVVYLTKDDPELAFKIGKDMIAKYKAEKEGL